MTRLASGPRRSVEALSFHDTGPRRVLSYAAQRLRGVSKEKEGHQSGGLRLFRSEGTQLRLFARETQRIISAQDRNRAL